MWSALPQIPTIAAPSTGGDSWNLNRRRHFISQRQVRPQGAALTQVSFRNVNPDPSGQFALQNALQNASPDQMFTEDAEMIREVYENHANRFFEDLRGDMLKQTAALVQQTQLSKKPAALTDKEPAPPDTKGLQEQINVLRQQVQELQKSQSRGIDLDAVRALCTEVVHRVLAERGPLLNEQHLRPLEAKLVKIEQNLQTTLTCELQELRVTSSRLVKRVNHVAATSGQLDERLSAFEKERTRVGTARADEWMTIARRQLEDFGNNLKSARSKAADPAAEELLTAMARAREALESGQKARESLEQASSTGMGLVMWGKGDMMQMHACLQEEDVRSTKPMAVPVDANIALPMLIEESSSPSPARQLSMQSHPRIQELTSEDMELQKEFAPVSADKLSEVKAKAIKSLEKVLLMEDWLPEEDDDRPGPQGAQDEGDMDGQKLAFLMEQKAKARAALEELLLGDDIADFEDEDDPMDYIEDTKARARAALESHLLGDLFGLNDDDDEEAPQDVNAIKQKACESLEKHLLGDLFGLDDEDVAPDVNAIKQRACESLEKHLLGDLFGLDDEDVAPDVNAIKQRACESLEKHLLGDLFGLEDDDVAPQDVNAIKQRACESLEKFLLDDL